MSSLHLPSLSEAVDAFPTAIVVSWLVEGLVGTAFVVTVTGGLSEETYSVKNT